MAWYKSLNVTTPSSPVVAVPISVPSSLEILKVVSEIGSFVSASTFFTLILALFPFKIKSVTLLVNANGSPVIV